MSEYPTIKNLTKIEHWANNLFELAEYICDIWNTNYGIATLTGKRIKTLKLITGGWSGNEEIINILGKTMFWFLYWEKSQRGGLYVFKIYEIKEKK